MLNNSSNLYGNEWLAVIFNKRNQNYGAYVLRLQSTRILLKSFLIAAGIFVLLFLIPLIYSKNNTVEAPLLQTDIVIDLITPVQELKKEKPKQELLQQKELPQPIQKVKTINFSAPVVVDNVIADPPTTVAINNAVVASTSQEGVESVGNAQISVNNGTGTGLTTVEGNGNEIFNVAGVETYPEFPGGMTAWAKFIQRNLRYPYAAQDNGAQGKVYLSFVVEKDGSITDVQVLRGIGYGCDEEAVRVIKKSPKWKAGLQNNQTVRVRYSMPIAYTLN